MMFLENSFTFNSTQVILLIGTIGMELKELYIAPLRRFRARNALTVHEGIEK